MGWFDKVLMNYPEVHQTSFLSPPITQQKPEMVLHPSLFTKLIAIPLILIALLSYIPLFHILRHETLPVLIPITGIFFISFILYLLIWHSFLNPKFIYRIHINNQFIEAGGKKYYWKDIADTCILTRMEGRISNSYLVILKLDGGVEKMDLFKFQISNKKLAGVVEFYKQQNELNKAVKK